MLFDTAVALWAVLQPDRLGPSTRVRIDGVRTAHFSAVSIAELTIKSMTGKLDVPPDLATRFKSQGLTELPLTAADSVALTGFPELARHDPFDRLLVAQAHVRGMEFLTSDRRLLSLDRDFIVDATA